MPTSVLPPENPPQSDPSQQIVLLADGQSQVLTGMPVAELQALQWQQEQAFARAIQATAPRSCERSQVIGQAYDTVCSILVAQQPTAGPLAMGLDPRYVQLVLDLLDQQVQRGLGQPRLFEIGYGSGMMLEKVDQRGFSVSGLEVSAAMREEALQVLGAKYADRLLLGDLLQLSADALPGRPSLVYWNDVFEHVCPDEIADYLDQIYTLLLPGGSLITITPNWLLRPSDVTGDFCPPRTEARGLHLKEYRLAEVTRLLRQAGFRRVAVPWVVTKKRIYTAGSGGRLVKQLVEPVLDWLPLPVADVLCRGGGMSCTIATK